MWKYVRDWEVVHRLGVMSLAYGGGGWKLGYRQGVLRWTYKRNRTLGYRQEVERLVCGRRGRTWAGSVEDDLLEGMAVVYRQRVWRLAYWRVCDIWYRLEVDRSACGSGCEVVHRQRV